MAKEAAKVDLVRVHCNSCRRKTMHRLVATAIDEGTDWNDHVGEIEWRTLFDLLQCCGCGEAVLRRTYSWSEDPDPDVRYFPPPVSRQPPRWKYKLPTEIRVILEEVYRSLDANTHALPMMGARTLLDILMVQKVGDVGSFKQKLKKLQASGLVSAHHVDVLDAALDAGSAAAHRGHAPEDFQVNTVMDIVENLLQALYVLPGMADTLKKTTPKRQSSKQKP